MGSSESQINSHSSCTHLKTTNNEKAGQGRSSFQKLPAVKQI